jgi:hypothetical protein
MNDRALIVTRYSLTLARDDPIARAPQYGTSEIDHLVSIYCRERIVESR